MPGPRAASATSESSTFRRALEPGSPTGLFAPVRTIGTAVGEHERQRRGGVGHRVGAVQDEDAVDVSAGGELTTATAIATQSAGAMLSEVSRRGRRWLISTASPAASRTSSSSGASSARRRTRRPEFGGLESQPIVPPVRTTPIRRKALPPGAR